MTILLKKLIKYLSILRHTWSEKKLRRAQLAHQKAHHPDDDSTSGGPATCEYRDPANFGAC